MPRGQSPTYSSSGRGSPAPAGAQSPPRRSSLGKSSRRENEGYDSEEEARERRRRRQQRDRSPEADDSTRRRHSTKRERESASPLPPRRRADTPENGDMEGAGDVRPMTDDTPPHPSRSSRANPDGDADPGYESEEEARRKRRRREREDSAGAGSRRGDERDRSERSGGDRDRDRRRDRDDKRRTRDYSEDRGDRRRDSGRRGEDRDRHRSHRDRDDFNDRTRRRSPVYTRPISPMRQRSPAARMSGSPSSSSRRRDRSPVPPPRTRSPPPPRLNPDEKEARSVFVSQLAAKLTSRDLGMFFEEMLGEGSVADARVVTDRVSRRSKGIAYVEFTSIPLVERAIALTGTIVMGLPISVMLTESERNKTEARVAVPGQTGGPTIGPGSLPPLHMGQPNGNGLPPQSQRDQHANAAIPYHRLYVGSLNFELTAEDVKQVFEPFGDLEYVDLHREPALPGQVLGKSKGFCFVQYKDLASAQMALDTMNGFELAGRALKVSTVNEKAGGGGPVRPSVPGGAVFNSASAGSSGGNAAESLDENHGTRLDHASRQALMQKLARQDVPSSGANSSALNPRSTMMVPVRPNIPVQPSVYVLVTNVFDPAEETERDWDQELEVDFKTECEAKYGPIQKIKVEKESQGEVYIHFKDLDSSAKAVQGLNGRFFGGKALTALYISSMIFQAHL